MKGLTVTDMHLRERDYSTIKGYTDNTFYMLDNLEELVIQHKPDFLIFLSDIFDKGYRDQAMRETHRTRLERIINRVDVAYNVIGNHLFKDRDANPEFYMIQPCSLPSKLLQPRTPVFNKEPLLKCVPYIMIDNVRLSFFHHDKRDKNYIARNIGDVKYHIAFYHDECVLPGPFRQKMGMDVPASSTYLDNLFANVDFGVLGDIHVKMGIYDYPNGKTTICVPGACSITSVDYRYIHETVELPLFTIENNTVKVEYVSLKTGMENLQMSRDPLKMATSERNITAKALKQLGSYSNVEKRARSFDEYIAAHNLPIYYSDLLDAAAKGQLDYNSAFDIIQRGGVTLG